MEINKKYKGSQTAAIVRWQENDRMIYLSRSGRNRSSLLQQAQDSGGGVEFVIFYEDINFEAYSKIRKATRELREGKQVELATLLN